MMIKRRIDEDFKHVWAINWNGLPEDFSDATEIVLTASVYGKKKQLERGIDYVIEDNLIIVDFTPRFATITGIYNLELKYTKPSDGFIDGERRSAVDLDVVQIVARSSQVTDTGDITSTSEAAFGFQGLSAFEVWLKDNPGKTKEDYYNWLRQPATDAVSLIDDKIEHLDEVIDSSTENEAERVGAETLRLQSENLRVSAETERKANEVERLANESSRASDELIREANESSRKQDEATRKANENEREIAETTRVSNENNRVTAEQERVQAESLRTTAESSRELAESLRVDAEILRQTNTQIAITNAEDATENANTAAQNADDAREAIQDDLALKANHGYGVGETVKTLKEVESIHRPFAKIEVSGLREVYLESIDYETGTLYATNHGFVVGKRLSIIFRGDVSDPALKIKPNNLNYRSYWVRDATANTFKLATSDNDASIIIPEYKEGIDLSKFSICEYLIHISFEDLPPSRKWRIVGFTKNNRGNIAIFPQTGVMPYSPGVSFLLSTRPASFYYNQIPTSVLGSDFDVIVSSVGGRYSVIGDFSFINPSETFNTLTTDRRGSVWEGNYTELISEIKVYEIYTVNGDVFYLYKIEE